MAEQVTQSISRPESRIGKETSKESPGTAPPTPERFFNLVNAFQRTEALKGAIELDLFTAVAEGNDTSEAIAERCGASQRGARILCDFLVTEGLLEKKAGRYALTPDSAAFLDRNSPAYLGTTIRFLASPQIAEAFRDVAGLVRKGGTLMEGSGAVEAENPAWVEFARSMAPLMVLPSKLIAEEIVGRESVHRVLDIAAGHGLFGIAIAKEHPEAEVVALDWPSVLEVAKENAKAAGIAKRYRTIPGDAFQVPLGQDYDLVLLTNFLHHFDHATNVNLLKKVVRSLRPGGRAIALEFIPDEDRVTPPVAAAFSLVMLAATPAGDAYTFKELERMFREAGFLHAEMRPLPPTMQRIVIARK